MSARELLYWSPYLNLCPEGSILMLKKQDLVINPYVANIGSRDHSLIGIGGPRVYVFLKDDLHDQLRPKNVIKKMNDKYKSNPVRPNIIIS